MTIYVPYTYLIGWRNHNKWYYGAQFNKTANPSDLWVTYFTSSKVVAAFRHQYGEPDVIEIRKTFTSKEKCLFWENAVLRKLNAAKSNLWLNKSNGAKDFYRIPGFKQSQETKDKIAKASIGNAANKGKIFSDEHKRKISVANTGRKLTEDQRKKNSLSHKGKKPSLETCKKLSDARKNIDYSYLTGRKWYNDGKRNYLRFTESADGSWNIGRIHV